MGRPLIGFDGYMLLPNPKGVGRFQAQVIEAFARHGEWFRELDMIIYHPRAWTPPHAGHLRFEAVDAVPETIWHLVRLPLALRRDGCQGFMSTADSFLSLPSCKNFVYLYEVPDYRARLLQAGGAREWMVKHSLVPRFAMQIDRVHRFACSSRATKRDLELLYRVEPQRCSVIPSGVAPIFAEGVDVPPLPELLDHSPYVLHFASTDPRDNTRVALEAFSEFVRWHGGGHKLVLAGNHSQSQEIKDWLTCYELNARTVCLGHLQDSQLISVYRHAWAYLDPSLFEGFGLQLVEAQAAGAPVIASNNSSIPEVTAPGTLLCFHDDVHGFAEALGALLNESVRQERIQAGRAHVAGFTWERTAKDWLAEVAEHVAQGPTPKGRRHSADPKN